jgi:tetratricopeptide (TPR) repeat protein
LVLAGALGHAVLAALAWNSLRRRRPVAIALLVAWIPLLFLGALAIRSEPLPAERHLYLSSVGWAWLGGAAFAWLGRQPRVRGAAASRAVAGLLGFSWLALAAAATWAVIPVWRDEPALFAGMQRAQPWSATGTVGLAMGLIEAGDDDAASRALDHAAALEPGRTDIQVFRAGIELRRGRPERTLALARSAQARSGASRDVALLEVQALQSLGRWNEASALVTSLHRQLPGDTGVLEAWALQMLVVGRPEEAEAELTRIISLQPRAAGLLELLGRSRAKLKIWPSARDAFQRSVAIEPDRYEAWLGLAEAYAGSGDRAAAVVALQQAARLPASSDGRAGRMLEEMAARPR